MYQSDLRHDCNTLADKLQHIYTLNRDRDLDLNFRPPYLSLLEQFGNPHLNLPPVIHAAGTNGKGSTLAFMRAMLEEMGMSVHVYSSPHLIKFNERIILAGEIINDAMLEDLIDEALDYNGDASVSFFEFTTAMAFAAFARAPADIVLLETGLGGRLDCTNLVPQPLATLITPIGLDHQDYLGETITEIASEKAGIMKAGTPCVIAAQNHSQALAALSTYASQNNVTIKTAGQDWSFKPLTNGGFTFTWGDKSYDCAKPALEGSHQISNAATAMAVIYMLQDTLPKFLHEQLNIALGKTRWNARMQNITSYFSSIPDHFEIWLDGGHNTDAAEAIINHIKDWDADNTHMICTMMRTKDASSFLNMLTPYTSSLTAVPLPFEQKAFNPNELQELLPHTKINTAASVPSALETVLSKPEKMQKQRVLICGSLYLAGHVLELLDDDVI